MVERKIIKDMSAHKNVLSEKMNRILQLEAN